MSTKSLPRRRSNRWITATATTLIGLLALPALSYTASLASPTHTSRKITIDASPETVWSVLTDFSSYPSWNPVITQIGGTPEVGETLEFTTTQGGGEMDFRPTVLAADPGQELRWKGYFLMPGLADGEHSFTLTPDGESTVLTQEESFTGVLAPFLPLFMDLDTSFDRSNEAIKARAEERQALG